MVPRVIGEDQIPTQLGFKTNVEFAVIARTKARGVREGRGIELYTAWGLPCGSLLAWTTWLPRSDVL